MGKRDKQKQIWVDEVFVDRLEKVKAKALLNNRAYKSLAELSNELVNAPAFDDVERQLVENDKKRLKGVRFDKNWY